MKKNLEKVFHACMCGKYARDNENLFTKDGKIFSYGKVIAICKGEYWIIGDGRMENPVTGNLAVSMIKQCNAIQRQLSQMEVPVYVESQVFLNRLHKEAAFFEVRI